MSAPLVTVCIPTYNSEAFIAEAIESVLAQNLTAFELLVIDNCSTDGTRGIVASYAARDARIVFLVNSANLGMVANWNRCLAEARGAYIKYLFSDDLLSSPDALERLLEPLETDSTVALVASARHIIDAESRPLRVLSHFRDGAVVDGERLVRRSLCEQRNLIGEPTVVMFRKCQAERGFDPRYRQLVDLEMWLHLLEKGKFAFIAAPLTSFRVHSDQQTQKNLLQMTQVDDMLLMLDEYLSRPYLRLGRTAREFLYYNQYYRLWKARRAGMLSRDEVFSRMAGRYPAWKFMALLPFYRIYSPLWKLGLELDKAGSR
ncbi:glycosyltransferase family 2 protein [Geomobilimonas luticola]|uniref:Glycosyltransferase n=1 Tax=Geomobilimonas luticola TaxID=1114878 RepID=A0ABS5SFS1_9BACT|nr:glycosyltransferase [Geomobilimonas luticola]